MSSGREKRLHRRCWTVCVHPLGMKLLGAARGKQLRRMSAVLTAVRMSSYPTAWRQDLAVQTAALAAAGSSQSWVSCCVQCWSQLSAHAMHVTVASGGVRLTDSYALVGKVLAAAFLRGVERSQLLHRHPAAAVRARLRGVVAGPGVAHPGDPLHQSPVIRQTRRISD